MDAIKGIKGIKGINKHAPIDGKEGPMPATNIDAYTTTSRTGADADASMNRSSLLPPLESIQLRPRIISLNIMVAGLAGLGKTTACTSLLDSWLHPIPKTGVQRRHKDKHKSTKVIDASRLFERFDKDANTILRVRIIDTPGFGNQVNHRNSVHPIAQYISHCRRRKYAQEMSSSRIDDYVNHTEDSLVHVCLYFLSPGRFLEIDKHFLKQIQKEVTVVPIIAKADTLTDEEIGEYRSELKDIFEKEKIHMYNFDAKGSPKGVCEYAYGDRFQCHRGRKGGEAMAIVSRDGNYPWGRSQAFDPDHSDLRLIRDLLLSEHTERFLVVALRKYANYRKRRIWIGKVGDVGKYVALVGLVIAQLTGFQFDSSDVTGETMRFIGIMGLAIESALQKFGLGGAFCKPFKGVATMDTDVVNVIPTNDSLSTSSEGFWNICVRLFFPRSYQQS